MSQPTTGAELEVLALIPARGGSQGIPRKNLVAVGGKPLLAHSIDQARAAPEINRVVVSTDDAEIARCAESYGAEILHRPSDLATAEATSESALLHALDHLRDEYAYEPDLVVFLQATSPLRGAGDISGAVSKLVEEGADSLFSACTVHGFVWRETARGLEALTYDYRQRSRRQDLDGEDLQENGSIYVFAPWVLCHFGNRLGGKIAAYRMDPLDSYQIDEPKDLEFFERLLAVPRNASGALDLAKIRLLVLDFDGVMTDDRVFVREDGLESVACSRGDGLGLERLRRAGRVSALVLSKERNPVVTARCRKLGLECIQGEDDKLLRLKAVASERGLDASQIAYVGNDVNDAESIAWSGVGIAVADATPALRSVADVVTRRPGGRGAVREVCELLLATDDQ